MRINKNIRFLFKGYGIPFKKTNGHNFAEFSKKNNFKNFQARKTKKNSSLSRIGN